MLEVTVHIHEVRRQAVVESPDVAFLTTVLNQLQEFGLNCVRKGKEVECVVMRPTDISTFLQVVNNVAMMFHVNSNESSNVEAENEGNTLLV